jgi:broad specificity phosphatase PhoE
MHMALPNHVVLVRHGLSEGNAVKHNGGEGDPEYYTDEFRERPGKDWRLMEQGVSEAKSAGLWIGKLILGVYPDLKDGFDLHMTSPLARPMETAGHLSLPNADWRIEPRIRERDWGDIESMTKAEHAQRYPENAAKKQRDPLYWRPPGGESIAQVADTRVRSILGTLHDQHDNKGVESAVLATHGEFIWAAHFVLERMGHEDWDIAEKDATRKIKNAQVVHFSRLDPTTGEQAPTLSWVRSVSPWETPESAGEWRYIQPVRYSNEDLLDTVHKIPPLEIPGAQSI